jgi:Protein of unknown function DUF2625
MIYCIRVLYIYTQAVILSNSTMTKYFLTIIISLIVFTTAAQNNMQSIDQLINTTDPGWPLVKKWIKAAKNKVEVLPVDTAKAKDALYKTQVTTRSPMGAIVYSTGGLLIDDGWIRILGSGSAKLNRTLPDWNKGKSFTVFGEAPGFLLIADDAVGGFFILNGGGLGKDFGKVYYLSPNSLAYEPLEITYTAFLQFCFTSDLNKFYKGLRFTKWRSEVAKLSGDEAFTFFPFLFTKEGKDINKSARSAIPVEEQYNYSIEMRKQIGL